MLLKIVAVAILASAGVNAVKIRDKVNSGASKGMLA